MTRYVLVLNHFAVPTGRAGGTRHVELFGRLNEGWSHMILAADRSLLTGKRDLRSVGDLRVVPTTPYHGNGVSRVLNWVSYAATATFAGMRSPRPNVVYASSPHLLAGLAGYLISRIRRAGLVLEIRDLWPEILVQMGRMRPTSLMYRLLRRLELFLYRKADEIVVLAEGSARAIRDSCPRAPAITFIPNGSDPGMFSTDADRAGLRDRFHMRGLAFVYAGAHGPANGLHLVLDAASEIRDELPEVQFILVGDGIEKDALTAEATRRGLDNVVFIDPVAKTEMPGLLAAADVGLHMLADVPLFRYGVSPNKLFDYMAAGLPVVTNCPGEVADLVTVAGAGIAIEPRGLADGVRAIARLDEQQKTQWGENGRRFIAESRSREVLAAKLEEVLNRVSR